MTSGIALGVALRGPWRGPSWPCGPYGESGTRQCRGQRGCHADLVDDDGHERGEGAAKHLAEMRSRPETGQVCFQDAERKPYGLCPSPNNGQGQSCRSDPPRLIVAATRGMCGCRTLHQTLRLSPETSTPSAATAHLERSLRVVDPIPAQPPTGSAR